MINKCLFNIHQCIGFSIGIYLSLVTAKKTTDKLKIHKSIIPIYTYPIFGLITYSIYFNNFIKYIDKWELNHLNKYNYVQIYKNCILKGIVISYPAFLTGYFFGGFLIEHLCK